MAYNRYRGNTGRVEHVPDAAPVPNRQRPGISPALQEGQRHANLPDARRSAPRQPQGRPPGPLAALGDSLGGILQKLSPGELETEDWLLLLILYLMYRESGDTELLLIMAAMYLF